MVLTQYTMSHTYLITDSDSYISGLLFDVEGLVNRKLLSGHNEELENLFATIDKQGAHLQSVALHDTDGTIAHTERPTQSGEDMYAAAVIQELRRHGWNVIEVPTRLADLVQKNISDVPIEFHPRLVNALINIGNTDLADNEEEVTELSSTIQQVAENRREWHTALEAKAKEMASGDATSTNSSQ